MNTTDQAKATGSGVKLPYSAPTLRVYGDLRTITAAKGGNRHEAGRPKTFSTAAP